MKRLLCIVALLLMVPAVTLADSNCTIPVTYNPHMETHEGDGRASIVVYTDEAFLAYHVITALNNLGLAYTVYYDDYIGFEMAVASGTFDVIVVDHNNYYEFSNAWDDIYNELVGGARGVICSFDWDGSNDASGYVDDVLLLGGHTHSVDWSTCLPVYPWPPASNPIWGSLPAVLNPLNTGYIDDGDEFTGDASNSFAGTTMAFDAAHVVMNYVPCQLVLAGWTPGQYMAADAVMWWENAITYVLSGVTPVQEKSWGAIKTQFR